MLSVYRYVLYFNNITSNVLSLTYEEPKDILEICYSIERRMLQSEGELISSRSSEQNSTRGKIRMVRLYLNTVLSRYIILYML